MEINVLPNPGLSVEEIFNNKISRGGISSVPCIRVATFKAKLMKNR
jgi:hypothetical protein